ncbi:putative bifunctional diguanylate cyclase/phosphodiesterase [Pseudorhodoferax sp.]|uniref:putative bifunctional diguanylate cyclase/phosphodiesterase n=1 Tax=Pseudorhodoferax sp. TaxID=1993553 RepID=UPI002DD65F1E|nr:EAL domain-containing protein [Pseudorhodoferax sp.]
MDSAPRPATDDRAGHDTVLASLLDRIGGYFYIKDRAGRYLFANAQVCALYGATPEQVVGAVDAQFMDTVRSPRVLMNDRAVLDHGEAIHDEEELCLRDGTRRGFRTTKLPILDGSGRVIAVCGLSTDITQRNWASGHLVERNHLLGTVLSNIDAHIYVKDNHGNYLYANEKTLALYGRTAAEVIGRHDRDLLPAEVAERLAATDQEVIRSASRHAREEVVIGADGKERHYWSIKLPLDLPGQPTGIIGFSTEITELLRLRQTLERQRITDALTGLPNRMQLEQELALELRLAQRDGAAVALVMLDIDQFKYINTHLGQEAGDQLLREAAQRLRQALPASCSLARLGGDEFAVVLPCGDTAELLRQVENLRAVLAEPYLLLGKPWRATASAGLATYPQDADSAGPLLINAEAAMYLAKERGRDQLRRYTADLGAAASRRLGMEHDLRGALAAGQFELHYQPKIRSIDSAVAGFEALLRWNRSAQERVSPLEFIPLAEQLGLLVQIGQWVVEQACTQMAQWRTQGLGRVSVAVNLSPSQLKSDSLLDSVCASVERHGIGAGELELEVTESMMMDEPEQAIAILRDLHEHGVQLSIDDFGTGYSSMAYLKRLPVDTLKLDRVFVSEIATDPRDADLCAGVIALAHKLGLRVVAEGVETEAQRQALAARDCDLFQGYLFSRPLAAAAVPAYLREQDRQHSMAMQGYGI